MGIPLKHLGIFLTIPGFVSLFSLLSAKASDVSIEPDKMLSVHGKRMFILGLYENPSDEKELERAVKAGFNLFRASPDTKALDRLQAHHVYAWVNTGMAIDLSEEQELREARLISLIQEVGSHPALLVLEVPDEALWNCWHEAITWRREQEPQQQHALIMSISDETQRRALLEQYEQVQAYYHDARYKDAEALADSIWRAMDKEPPRAGFGLANAQERAEKMCVGMVAGYKKIKELKANLSVWMNHAPRNQIEQLAAFNDAADIVGCDIYPVPLHPKLGHSDLKNRSMSCVGDYTQRMQQAAPGKPVWMVLQGFGWGDIQPEQSETLRKELRRPTKEETRFMAFNAIVKGARGILYWGTHAVEKDSMFYNQLLEVISELNDLQEILSAPDTNLALRITYQPTFGSVDRNVVVLPKDHGNYPWLIVVNEWTDPLCYTLHGLYAYEGIMYRDRYSGKETTVSQGKLTLSIHPESVHVLEPFPPQ